MSQSGGAESQKAMRDLLDSEWQHALSHPVEDPDSKMDKLVQCNIVGIRYATLTQLLGKTADPKRDALCLQAGEKDEPGKWNARTFAEKVIVPWSQENSNALGTSNEPYTSNPLRRARIDHTAPNIRASDRPMWKSLEEILGETESQASPEFTLNQLRRCLQSIRRRIQEIPTQYPVPPRASAEHVSSLVQEFLSKDHGGVRHLITTAAIMRAFNEVSGIFSRIESQKINEADAAAGAPGDILCYSKEDAKIALAIEVKDRKINITALHSTVEKARQSQTESILLLAEAITDQEMREEIRRSHGLGTDIRFSEVEELVRVLLAISPPSCRISFLREIGKEINDKAPHAELRIAWAEALKAMVDKKG